MRGEERTAGAPVAERLSEIDQRIGEVVESLDPSLDVAPVLKLALTDLEEEAKRSRDAAGDDDAAAASRFDDLRQAVVSARNAAALDTGVPPEAVRSLDEILELVHGLENLD